MLIYHFCLLDMFVQHESILVKTDRNRQNINCLMVVQSLQRMNIIKHTRLTPHKHHL